VGDYEEIIGLLLYGAFLLARRLLKKRAQKEAPEAPAPAPVPAPRRPPTAPKPVAPSAARGRTAVAPAIARSWRDLDARAVDLATLPTPWAIAQAFAQAGRAFFRSTPGLEPELRARMGLPRSAPLPESAETLVARDLALPMGPWLETLFADAWAVLALGPATVVALRHTLDPEDAEAAVTIHADDAGGYGATPPPHLRVLLACDLLAEAGHRAEASRQLTLWNGRIGAVDGFLLPTRRDLAEVPVDLLRAFGARVQAVIAAEPQASLGGASLGALDGLRFLPADQTAAERAASALANGMVALDSARVVLAAAVLAADDAPGHEGAILAALRRSLAPAASPAAVPESAGARAARAARVARSASRAAPGGAFLDLSPGGLREAVIARAILWR
jgi:hypothetical protein